MQYATAPSGAAQPTGRSITNSIYEYAAKGIYEMADFCTAFSNGGGWNCSGEKRGGIAPNCGRFLIVQNCADFRKCGCFVRILIAFACIIEQFVKIYEMDIDFPLDVRDRSYMPEMAYTPSQKSCVGQTAQSATLDAVSSP